MTICGIAWGLWSFAQTDDAYLGELSKQFSSIRGLHSQMKMIKSNGTTDEVEIWYNESSSRMVTKDLEMMLNSEYYVLVNKRNKTIHVQKRAHLSGSGQVKKNYQLPIDSLLAIAENVEVDSRKPSGERSVKLTLDHPVFKETTWQVDRDMKLKWVKYKYLDPYTQELNQIEVQYNVFKVNPSFSQNDFDVGRYVVKVVETWVPVKRYADYQVNEVTTYQNQ